MPRATVSDSSSHLAPQSYITRGDNCSSLVLLPRVMHKLPLKLRKPFGPHLQSRRHLVPAKGLQHIAAGVQSTMQIHLLMDLPEPEHKPSRSHSRIAGRLNRSTSRVHTMPTTPGCQSVCLSTIARWSGWCIPAAITISLACFVISRSIARRRSSAGSIPKRSHLHE